MKPEKTNPQSANPGDYLAANEQDHLQWLAFCYVADELTDSQRSDFESRLATDLKAQEALASAVELSCVVYENYQLQTESADGRRDSALLERVGSSNSTADRSSMLSRMLLMAAAVLVMAFVGYGLVQNKNLMTANSNLHNPSSPSSAQLSVFADDWIDSLDGDEVAIADSGDPSELSEWDSEEFKESVSSLDSNSDDDLAVDTSLISFYSEMLDSGPEDGLLNSTSFGQETGVEL